MSVTIPRHPPLDHAERGRVASRLPLDAAWLAAFCARWRIRELALFGSVLRDDWTDDSDVDVLVEFDADAPWSGYDLVALGDELAAHLGRGVDVVERAGLRNPFLRHAILTAARTIHVA